MKSIEWTKDMKLIDAAAKYNKNTAGDIIAAKAENRIISLTDEIPDETEYEFIDTASLEGIRIYRNTLKFVLVKVISDLFPANRLKIHYSVNKGAFCELEGRKVGREDVNKIRRRLKQLVSKKLPIERHTLELSRAKLILEHINRTDLLDVLTEYGGKDVVLYSLQGVFDYFYGILAPDTGYVDIFELKHFHDGFLLIYPSRFHPGKLPEYNEQHKLTQAFEEFRLWGNAIGVDNIHDLNRLVENGGMGDIIRISEALQEKKIGYIADRIKDSKKHFVFISGPSSSGKTTFAKRLSIHLRAVGLNSHSISLDDYYKGRNVPRDLLGKKDYETPDAFDVKRFREDMKSLQDTGRAMIPEYDFETESRAGYRELTIDESGVIIIEGIHGINPRFTGGVNRDNAHRLYVSALTSINVDDHNRLSTTDARLFRRLVRDYNYRSSSAERTLGMWPDVRKGEDSYIFPYQEEADEIFNSTLIYEHSVLKNYAEPILREVGSDSPYYSSALRLLRILSFFKGTDDSEIPNTSIIREFIGGSVLKY